VSLGGSVGRTRWRKAGDPGLNHDPGEIGVIAHKASRQRVIGEDGVSSHDQLLSSPRKISINYL
jgi:hypothetical protein